MNLFCGCCCLIMGPEGGMDWKPCGLMPILACMYRMLGCIWFPIIIMF